MVQERWSLTAQPPFGVSRLLPTQQPCAPLFFPSPLILRYFLSPSRLLDPVQILAARTPATPLWECCHYFSTGRRQIITSNLPQPPPPAPPHTATVCRLPGVPWELPPESVPRSWISVEQNPKGDMFPTEDLSMRWSYSQDLLQPSAFFKGWGRKMGPEERVASL